MIRRGHEPCHINILNAARVIVAQKAKNEFTVAEVHDYLGDEGIEGCSLQTIATLIRSRCYAKAHRNGAVTDPYFERIGPGRYRLLEDTTLAHRRVTEIHVSGLLHKFDYRIRLNLRERITILHGPNGCGKTSILALVAALFTRDFPTVRQIPFRVIRIFLDDASELRVFSTFRQLAWSYPETPAYGEILPLGDLSASGQDRGLYFDVVSPDDRHQVFALQPDGWRALIMPDAPDRAEIERLKHQIDQEKIDRSLLNLGPQPTEDQYRLRDLADRSRGSAVWDVVEETAIPANLDHMLKSGLVYSLRTDRLTSITMGPFTKTGQDHCSALSVIHGIEDAINVYQRGGFRHTSGFEYQFPELYHHAIENLDLERIPSTHESIERLEGLAEWWQKQALNGWMLPLGANGFDDAPFDDVVHSLEKKVAPAGATPEQHRVVLHLVVSHIDEMTKRIENVADRLTLFLYILKQLTGKEFIIDRDCSFIHDTQGNFNSIKPAYLSSGEQHLLVLFGALLFGTPVNPLVLIDEPELSLHVSWQRQFLQILEEIIALNPMDVVIATHSPQIVYDRRDLMVSLGPVE